MVAFALSIATVVVLSATLVVVVWWIRRDGVSWANAGLLAALAVTVLGTGFDLEALFASGTEPGLARQGLELSVAVALAMAATGLWRRRAASAADQERAGAAAQDVAETSVQVCRLTPDGRLTYANAAFLKVFGLSEDRAIGKSLYDVVSAFGTRVVRQHLARVTPDEPSLKTEHRTINDEGVSSWCRFTSTATYDTDNRITELQIVYRDITNQRRSMDELALSYDRLKWVQDTAGIGNFERDFDRGYCYWSDELYRIYEFDKAAGLPTHEAVFTRIHGDDLLDFRDRLAIAERTGLPYSINYRLEMPDGRIKHLRAHVEVVTDRQGQAKRLMGTVQDLTSATENETRVRDSEQRYQAIVEDQSELICRFLPDTTLTFVNKAYADYFGKTQDALIGTRFVDLIPESDHAGVHAHLASLQSGKGNVQYEHRVVDRQGAVRWQQWVDRVFRDETGKVIEMQSVGRDITALKQAEETLRDHESLLRQAQSVAGLGCWVWDHEGNEVYQSSEIAKMLGAASSTVSGLRDRDYVERFVVPNDRRRVLAAYQSFLEKRAPVTLEYQIVRPDGEQRTMRERLENVTTEEDAPTRVIGTLQDITREKQIQRALQDAHAAAEDASAAKTRFLAAASHDLRQPLHALRLLTECIGRARTEENRESIVREIKTALETMGGMLNALLDISELDSGTVQADHDDVEVDALLDHVLVTAAPLAERKDLELRRVPCSAVVHSDPSLLARILDNFLANAVRYTESGRILVGCRRDGDHLWIEIWDTGIGIPNTDLGRIFEEYYQLNNPSRDRSKGLGLGLSIVDRIATMLGHEVKARSVPGRGSVFSIRVPLSQARRRPLDIDDRPVQGAWTQKTVLVVDDDPMVLEATCHMLRQWDLTVLAAANRNDAFASIADKDQVPDFIVADYRLPKGDSGLQVIHDIRRAAGRVIPAVVITGDTSAAIAVTAEEAQCNTLHKPIDPTHLHRVMSAQFGA